MPRLPLVLSLPDISRLDKSVRFGSSTHLLNLREHASVHAHGTASGDLRRRRNGLAAHGDDLWGV
eukprot:744219-Prorocentrum_minimum.AAC.5